MYILTYFTENATPKTGLIPTIRIRDLEDNSLIITDASMTEVGDGMYKYDFTTFDSTKEYSIRCDGGATLADQERYTYASGNMAGETLQILEDTEAIQTDATTNTNNIITEVNANETKIDSIITSLSILVSNIWNYTTRTLTAGTKDSEIDEIKVKTDQLQFSGGDIIATLDGEVVNVSSTIENYLKYILGLVHSNYRMFDTTVQTVGSSEKIVSSKVRIYENATDCENDENYLKEYDMDITYDANGKVSEYKTKEVI